MAETTPTIADGLWNDPPSLGDYETPQRRQDHLMDQYRICVEMADRISSRCVTRGNVVLLRL
jgi:hypothetical protein